MASNQVLVPPYRGRAILAALAGFVTRQQHLVGGPDSGGGIPFLNWSTTYGDLRIAHFSALHAIQIFMLLGLWLSTTRITRNAQVAIESLGCWWTAYAVHQPPFWGVTASVLGSHP